MVQHIHEIFNQTTPEFIFFHALSCLFYVCMLFVINLNFNFLALSIILEISYLTWSKTRQKPGHVLDFCVEYYFKSSIPQDVDNQLRAPVPRSKNKWRLFQKKSCMFLILIFLL